MMTVESLFGHFSLPNSRLFIVAVTLIAVKISLWCNFFIKSSSYLKGFKATSVHLTTKINKQFKQLF